MKSVTKKSWGGLKKKAAKDAEKTQKLASSEINSNGDLTLFAGDDITIAGSDLNSNGNLNITAFDELLITSVEESSQSESIRKKGGFLTGGSFYSSKEKMDGEAITNAYASNLNSGGNLNIDVGSAVVVASNINAGESLNIQTDISDIDILSATETVSTKSHSKEMKISFGDALKGFADPSDMVKVEDGQLKFSLASATYDEVDVKTERTSQHGSTLSANNNLTLDSVADINIEGSDLFADISAGNSADVNGSNASADNTVNNALNNGSINLFAGGDVSITEAEESYKEVTKEIHGTGEVSLVVQNQAVEVVKQHQRLMKPKMALNKRTKTTKNTKKNVMV